MRVYPFIYIFIIVSNALLFASDLYYIYQLKFLYQALTFDLFSLFLINFIIYGLFIYLSIRKIKMVFFLTLLVGIYVYYQAASSFGILTVLQSAIEHFTLSTLLNFLNPVVALFAILYWLYDANRNKQRQQAE